MTRDAPAPGDGAILEAIRREAVPLRGEASDYDGLLRQIGEARLVLIGDASHGTHELYRERAEITKRLIAEKGFNAVAVEADWPDAWRLGRFVRGFGNDNDAVEALGGFRRFPAWMWRNADVLDFAGWLREWNDGRPGEADRTGFYGLDLYSFFASAEAVLQYARRVDPGLAERLGKRYACLEDAGEDAQGYGWEVTHGKAPCEDEVVAVLHELQRERERLVAAGGPAAEDAFFFAHESARVVRDAEAYYRESYRGEVSTWNLRDRHMVEALEALEAHLLRRTGRAKVAVWAHNSHIGDARATESSWRRGEVNLGQLVRERWPDVSVLVGFTTYEGTVSAASDWGGPVERKRIRPALPGSVEALFHELGHPRFLLDLADESPVARALRIPRLERFIGVIYRPETERWSHYSAARVAEQFDAVIHVDQTRAVEPLERTSPWIEGEAETWPSTL